MKIISNQNGFTYILALTIVMIMGVMLSMVGQSWKTIKQREQEKELLFRGSQIKEAIENWYNPNYTMPGISPKARHPLMDLKDLLQDPYSLTKQKFLPQNYGAEVAENTKCAPDCAKLRIYQDPMTGKEWTIIRGSYGANGAIPSPAGTLNGGIIGVASKSEENSMKTKSSFKDTALENMFNIITGSTSTPTAISTPVTTTVPKEIQTAGSTTPTGTDDSADKPIKFSEWKFIADIKNDHRKIFRAYHETW